MDEQGFKQAERQARAAYYRVLDQLTADVHRCDELRVPLRSDDGAVPAWTDDQVNAVGAVANGWRAVVTEHREYTVLLASREQLLSASADQSQPGPATPGQ